MSVTVGVPVVLAVRPTVAGVPQVSIAFLRFVARSDVVESTKKFAVVFVVHEVALPLVPAVTMLPLPHKNAPSPPPPTVKVVELPSSVSMTVTVPPLALAVTPVVAEEHALIAFLRFVARVVVLRLVAYLPVALPVHVLAPPLVGAMVPPLSVTAPQEKIVLEPETPRKVPGFVWTTLTVLELRLAVTPSAEHIPIASATFEAKPALVLLVAKCPVKAGPPAHVSVPSLPAVVVVQLKLLVKS